MESNGGTTPRAPKQPVFKTALIRKYVLDPRAEYLDLRAVLFAACNEIDRLRAMLPKDKA